MSFHFRLPSLGRLARSLGSPARVERRRTPRRILGSHICEPLEARIAPAGVVFTKTVTVVGNPDATAANSGDTLHYVVTFGNGTGADITGAQFSDLLDANTNFVPGTAHISPIALNDTYTATGNTLLVVGGVSAGGAPATTSATGLLANDLKFNVSGANDTFSIVSHSTPGHGSLPTFNADGSFSYVSAPGYTGTDTFTYTYQNTSATGAVLTDTATVTINVANTVWYVDNSAGTNGNGTSNSPFNVLNGTTLNGAGGVGDVDAPTDYIYLAKGSGAYTGGLVLEANQHLIGAGASLIVGGTTIVTGSAGNTPTLSHTTGTTLLLSTGNDLHGLTITNSAGAGITGTAVGTTIIGGAAIDGVSVSATGGPALSITTSGALTATFTSLSSTGSATNGFLLTGATGSVTVNGGSISGAASAAFSIVGGTVSVNSAAGLTQANNAPLVSVSGGHSGGTIQFQTGTLDATNGTGLQFDNADGTYLFLGTTTLHGGDAGIDIVNGSSGIFTFGSGTSIANPTGTAFNLNSPTQAVDYAGTLTKTSSGLLVEIQNHTSTSAIGFSGAISATGASSGLSLHDNTAGTYTFSNVSKTLTTGINNAISLVSNTGAVVNFSNGGLAITTTTGKGLTATGGGTLNVTGTGNTISAGSGTALEVVNTLLGTGLTFQSVSSSGGTGAGIILDNTGASGALTITGVGTTAGSGGTIANKTGSDIATVNADGTLTFTGTSGTGIFLRNTRAISLVNMTLHDFSNFGLAGSSVTGLTLNNTSITGTNGDNAQYEGAVHLDNLLGSASVQNATFSGSAHDNISLINNTGTLNRIVFDTVIIGTVNDATGDDGLFIQARDTAVVNVTVQNSTFNGARGDLFQFDLAENGTGQHPMGDLVFKRNSLLNTQVSTQAGGGGMTLSGGGATNSNVSLTYDIGGATAVDGNTFRGARGDALLIALQTGGGSFVGKIRNNTFGASATNFSGSSEASTIEVRTAGSGNQTVLIDSNNLSRFENYGILLQIGAQTLAGNGTAGSLNATVTNNTISTPNSDVGIFAKSGLYLNAGTNSGDQATIGLNFQNNTIAGTGTDGASDVYLRERFLTTVKLPGYAGANNDNTAVGTYLKGRTTGTTPSTLVTNNVSAGGGGYAGGTVTAPPLLFQPTVAEVPAPVFTPATEIPATTGGGAADLTAPAAPVQPGTTTPPAGATNAPSTLTAEALSALVSAAITRWEMTGLTPAQSALLQQVTFSLSDLDGLRLGEASPGHITLDVNAAGNGWFIDATPLDDSEFAVAGSGPAAGRVDALTTVLHELGHQLGLEDDYSAAKSGDVMSGYLTLGTRHLPAAHEAEGAFGMSSGHVDYLSAPLTATFSVPAGKTLSIVYDATVNTGTFAAGVNNLTNNASVTYGATTLNATASIPLNAAPDLAITSFTDGVTKAAPGDTVTYTIGYQNSGNQNATGVVLSETLPAGATFNAAGSPGWSLVSGRTYQKTISSLNAGATGSATFSYLVAGPAAAGLTALSSTVTIADDAANGPDTTANNSATDSNTLNAQYDLVLTKTADVTSSVAGGVIKYTLGFSNSGNQNTSASTITETLPAHTSFNAGQSSSGWSTSDGTHYTFNSGALVGGAAAGSVIFAVTVDNPANATQVSNTATIADPVGGDGTEMNTANNTPATVITPLSAIIQFSAGSYQVMENGVAVGTAITLLRSGDISGSSSVTVSFADGTAVGGTDFNGTAQVITFAANETSKTVIVPITDDTVVEGSESLSLTLGTPANALLGPQTSASLTITDNDTATLAFSSTGSNAGEGDGTLGVGVQLVITANGVAGTGTLGHDVSVNVQDLLTGSATSVADYGFTSPATLTFAAGAASGTVKTATLSLVNDTVVEGTETVNLALRGLSDVTGQVTLGGSAHAVTIADNDFARLVFASAISSVNEAAGTHGIDVTLVITANGVEGTGSLGHAVSVQVSDVGDGTATAGGTDYAFTSPATLTFAAASASGSVQTATLSLNNDTLVEGAETVHLALGNVVDSTGQVALGSAISHTATIQDNDTAAVFFTTGTSHAGEGDGAHLVDVQLVITANGVAGTGTLAHDLDVTVSTAAGGTATAGDDFALTGTAVHFAAGAASSTKSATVTPVNDTLIEGSETVNLSLGGLTDSTGQVALGVNSHTVTIDDNDTATLTFVDATSSVSESSATHSLDVQLVLTANGVAGTGSLAHALSVEVQDLGTGSATGGGEDFSFSSSQTLTFAAGSTSGATRTVTLALNQDTLVEGSETVQLGLANLSDTTGQATLGAGGHTVTILDNDTATIALASVTSTAHEGDGTHQVGVQLIVTANGVVGTGTLAHDLAVSVQDAGTGTATGDGTDYTFASPTKVTFAAGSASSTQNVSVDLHDDNLVEGTETLALSLGGLSTSLDGQVTLGGASHLVAIADNDVSFHVTQSESMDPVVAGQAGTLTYIVTVQADATDATGVTLSDVLTLPAGVTFVSAAPSAGTFDPATGHWTLGDLAAHGTATLQISLAIGSQAAAGTDVVANTASVITTGEHLVDGGHNSATEATSITRSVDLAITSVSDGVITVHPNDALTYTIAYANQRPSDAQSAFLLETLPAGTSFDAAHSTSGWAETTVGSGVYRLDLHDLAAGATGSATFAVKVNGTVAAGQESVTNTVTIGDDGTAGSDPTPNDNSATDTNTLVAAPDLAVTIGATPSYAQRGVVLSYPISYTNHGSRDATGVTLVEHLPAHTAFVGSGWVETTPGVFTLQVGTLAAGASGTATFAVRVDSTITGTTAIVNALTIGDGGANGTDLTPSDNTANLSTPLYNGIYVVSQGITYAGQFGPSTIQVYDAGTGARFLPDFNAYEAQFRDSVRVAVADLNGDGFDDIITTTGTGTGRLRVFDGLTGQRFTSGPWSQEYAVFTHSGAFVAAGDVNGDGRADVVVGSGSGAGGLRVFDGVTGAAIAGYNPFGPTFLGGVRVAVGDVNGDGHGDVITGQGTQGALVRVYSSNTTQNLATIKIGAASYQGGVSVATADLDGDHRADLIVGRNSGVTAIETIKIVNAAAVRLAPPLFPFDANPAHPTYDLGVRVAAVDVNLDGVVDIIAGAGGNKGSQVKIFDGAHPGQLLRSFSAFPNYPLSSLFVAGSALPEVARPV